MDEKKTKNSLIVLSVVLGIFVAAFIGFLIYYLISQPASQSVQSKLDEAQQKLIDDLINQQKIDVKSITDSIISIKKQIKDEDVLNKLNILITTVSNLSKKQVDDHRNLFNSMTGFNAARASEISELSIIQASDNTARASEISGLSSTQALENADRASEISALSAKQALNHNAMTGAVSELSVKHTSLFNSMTGLSEKQARNHNEMTGAVSELSVKHTNLFNSMTGFNAARASEIGALTQSLNTLTDPQKGKIADIMLSISNLTGKQLEDIEDVNDKFTEIRGLIDSNQTSLRNSLSTNEIRITAKDGSIWKVIIDNNGKLCFNHLDYLVCLDDIQYNMNQIISQQQKQKQK